MKNSRKSNTARNLNIALVCDAIDDYKAGSFISTLRIAEILKRRGYKIILIGARSAIHPKDNYYKGMKVYRFPSILLPKSEKKFYMGFASVRKLKKIFKEEKIDIVHTILVIPLEVASLKAAKALGIKTVVHCHTQPENVFVNIPKFLGREILNKIFAKYILWVNSHANALIYPSEFAKKLFPKTARHIKSAVISNGVDTSKFAKMNKGNLWKLKNINKLLQKFFRKYNLPKGRKNILFVGRLHPEKNIQTILKAAPLILKKEPKAYFYIVGEGYQENYLKNLAKNLKINKNVKFFGQVSDEELIMAYNACDIFVLPSFVELEGMVVLEAMSCGKPILIANSPRSASAYFVNENGFLFELENEKDLALQALKLLKNEDLKKKMGEKSRKDSKKYDINASVSKLEKVYLSILKNKK